MYQMVKNNYHLGDKNLRFNRILIAFYLYIFFSIVDKVIGEYFNILNHLK